MNVGKQIRREVTRLVVRGHDAASNAGVKLLKKRHGQRAKVNVRKRP